jgi:asparagine synthase (glutamine-hydrolysing)
MGGAQAETHADLPTALHNRFEVASETVAVRDRLLAAGLRANRGTLESIDLLNYNLGALLHRNDSMGMAASIASRFPFLSTRLVRLAVNLPYATKMRFVPTLFDRDHAFFEDKWILRKVAERYLPRELSARPKKPFPVNAYSRRRLRISPAFFDDSFVANLFGLSSTKERLLVARASHDLKVKLMQLEVWAHVCLNRLPKESILRRLKDHVTVRDDVCAVCATARRSRPPAHRSQDPASQIRFR